MPFEYDRGADSYCAACLAKPPKHDGIRAAVKYDDLSAKVALRLKYSGKIGLAARSRRKAASLLSLTYSSAKNAHRACVA